RRRSKARSDPAFRDVARLDVGQLLLHRLPVLDDGSGEPLLRAASSLRLVSLQALAARHLCFASRRDASRTSLRGLSIRAPSRVATDQRRLSAPLSARGAQSPEYLRGWHAL